MAVNVAKQIYFDEFNSFYQIAETKDDGYFSTKQIKCYIEYTDKIIDEILKQNVVLGGEQNSSN